MPSWVGDSVMATPTLRVIRESFPGAFIGALVRPGIDAVLAGLDSIDEVHVERADGVMGPKHVASKIRPRRYDTALILPNSFSSALITRIAGIPRRLGYNRDARGLLLTESLKPPRRANGDWAIVPAVDYYYTLAAQLLGAKAEQRGSADGEASWSSRRVPGGIEKLPDGRRLELATTPEDEALAGQMLARSGVSSGERLVMLNPGANKDFKRWPAERFGMLARALHSRHGVTILLNGSPAENDLIVSVASSANCPTISLPSLGGTLGTLKSLLKRCSLMVTNDTGPRHIAAAMGTPLITLFGPNDPRWVPIPTRPGAPEVQMLADPTLPEEESANDHPERCRIDRISVESVEAAAARLLG